MESLLPPLQIIHFSAETVRGWIFICTEMRSGVDKVSAFSGMRIGHQVTLYVRNTVFSAISPLLRVYFTPNETQIDREIGKFLSVPLTCSSFNGSAPATVSTESKVAFTSDDKINPQSQNQWCLILPLKTSLLNTLLLKHVSTSSVKRSVQTLHEIRDSFQKQLYNLRKSQLFECSTVIRYNLTRLERL